jgi:hypothetical protein
MPSGANWLTSAAPHDTATPTTLPAFLKRRQTELKFGIPVLVALILAGVLFKVLQSSHAPSDSLATPLEPIQPAQVEPRAGAQPIAPAPTIRLVPGGSAVVAAPPGAPPALPPGVQPVGPVPRATVVPQGQPLPAQQAPAQQPPAPAAAQPRAAPSSAPSSAPPPRSAPNKQRRPSLKQIGIEE